MSSTDSPATGSSESKPQILILKANPHGIRPAEIFLQKRGIEFFSTSIVREAMTFIIKKHPRFLLLAADHPNKKVRLLPKLLSQAFEMVVIGFTESSSPLALFSLQELQSECILYPPLSGPAIIRMISRVEDDVDKKFLAGRQRQEPAFGRSKNSLQDQSLALLNEKLGSPQVKILLELMGENTVELNSEGHQQKPSTQEFSEPAILIGIMRSLKILESQATGPAKEKVGKTTRLSCLSIEAPQVQGYLLVALGNNRQMDASLMDLIRDHLNQFFRESTGAGASAELSSAPYEIDIQEMEFSAWASVQAQFLLKSVHAEQEVAIAFLASNDVNLKWQPSVDGQMAQIEIKDIASDFQLDFDLFVYLPQNQKYVLYNKKGRTMFEIQKQRLIERGVSHVHCTLEAVAEVRKHRAQVQVNRTIDESSN